MSPPHHDLLSPENLKKLRSDKPPIVFPLAPSRNSPIRGQFLRGPIPLPWLAAAANLPGKAPLAVALAIRFEARAYAPILHWKCLSCYIFRLARGCESRWGCCETSHRCRR